jgi:hypothetical protein
MILSSRIQNQLMPAQEVRKQLKNWFEMMSDRSTAVKQSKDLKRSSIQNQLNRAQEERK